MAQPTTKRTRWLVVGGALLVSVLALLARLRGTQVTTTPLPVRQPEMPEDWLVTTPPVRPPVRRRLSAGLVRWLRFVALLVALVLAFLVLPRFWSVLALGLMLVGWGVLVIRSSGLGQYVPRIRLLEITRRALTIWWLRWLLFIVVALALYSFITALSYPYSAVVLVTLVAGFAPVGLAQIRASMDERVSLVRGLTLVAVIMAVASMRAFQEVDEAHFADAWRTLMIGAGALALAVHVHLKAAATPDIPAPGDQPLSPAGLGRFHQWLLGLGGLLLLMVAEANGRWLNIPLLAAMTHHAQFALLVLSLALITIGLGGIEWRWPPIRWRVVGPVLLLTALALGLRLWNVDNALRLFVDELNFAGPIRQFREAPNVPLLEPMSSVAAFPYMYPYWQAQAIELLGRNLVGLRVVSALVGALTIPAVYGLGRALFDRKTALLAALLLATFPPHLHFSRLGLNNIADPLFGTLGIAFVARGLMTSRRGDYVLGGVLLGLTQYFYEGGRLIFMPTVALWLVGLVILWGPRVRWRTLLLVALAALIVALPIYYTLTVIDRPLAARLVDNQMALDGQYWQRLLATGRFDVHLRQRVIHPFLLYVQAVEGSFFYRGTTAFLLPLLVPGFFLGIGYSLSRLRRPGPLIVLLLWLATTFGNSLLVEADHAPRFVLIFPVLMLLVAVGIRYTLPMLLPHYRHLRVALMIALVVGLAAYQTDYYFNRHLITYNHQLRNDRPHPDAQDAVMRSLNFPPDTELHFISKFPPDDGFTRGFLRFFTDDLDLDSLQPDDVTARYIVDLNPVVDHAFFVEPGHDEVIERLNAWFYLLPAQYSPRHDITRNKQFPLYYAPYLPDDSDAPQP